MLTSRFLSLQSVYFRLLGFNIFACSGSWMYPCRTIFCILSVVTFMPLTVAFSIYHLQNVDRLTDGLCSGLVDLLALFKVALILWRHKDFERLIKGFESILSRESQILIYAQIIENENQREQFISRLYKNCFQLAAILGCILPWVRMMYSYFHAGSGPVLPELPFPSIYPWDNRRVFNYLVSYAWNVSAAFGVLLPTVCVDTLFCSLTHNLCALLKIVQYKIRHFMGATLKDTQSNLGHIISLYQDSLAIGNTVNRCFRPLITIQFIVASLHLCVLSYQLSANLTQPELLFYAAFTCSMLGQLYLYCYCGECVKTESSHFALAIYESSWYENRSTWSAIGRPLQLSIMRAQRGTHVKGYFFEANMQTLLSIVRTALSYVTLLRSVS